MSLDNPMPELTPDMHDVEVTNVFRRNVAMKKEVVVNVGGAGSSKSHSILQKLIFKRTLPLCNRKILVLRKTRKANEMSVYRMFLDQLNTYGLYDRRCHNKSKLEYTFPNNNWWVFSGFDDREKIKSTEWTDIWQEEASQFTREDHTFCKTRLFRGKREDPKDYSQLTLSLNPINCWVKNLGGTENVGFIHSTYKDNPFMNKQAVQTLLNLKTEDITYYNIYALGQWSTPEHIIYKPYKMIQQVPVNLDYYDDIFYGLDFGYNVQTALGRISYRDDERYLKELLYMTKLTNGQLIEKLKDLVPDALRANQGNPIYADHAEPDRIQEIYDAGFNIKPADKQVARGIDYCKRQTYYSDNSNVNLNEEHDAYKWKQDRNGNVLDEPVKFKDHLMDMKRYAEYTHNKLLGKKVDWDKFTKSLSEARV